MGRPDRHSPFRGHVTGRLDRDLHEYVMRGERVVVSVRTHWVAHIKPFAAALLLLFLALYVDVTGPRTPGGQVLSQGMWLLWLVSLGWLIWDVLNWRRDWFVATDKRFLMFYGFIHRKVAMMPLVKVTDLTFNRSIIGRLLGYGDFTLESAGQHQALGHIEYIPNANQNYRLICEVLFADDDPRRSAPDADDPSDAADDWEDPSGDDPFGGGERGGGPHAGGPHGGSDDSGYAGSGGSLTSGAYAGLAGTPAYAASDARAFGIPVPAPTPRRRDRRLDDVAEPAPEYVYRSSDRVIDARRADTDEIPVIPARPLPAARRPARPRPPRPPRQTGGRHTEELLFPPEEWLNGR